MTKLRPIAFALAVAAIVAAVHAGEPAKGKALIPRDVLFGNPDRAAVRLSPDGQQLAYIAPLDGVMNIWVAPAADPSAAKAITHDKGRGIRQYFWAYTNQHILYLQDKDGDENWRVYSLDLRSGEAKDLTPAKGVQARIQEVSEKHPAEILIALNDRNPQLHDIYRVNVDTGEKKLVLENDGYAGYLTDDDYAVRFAMRITPDGGSEVLERTPQGEWTFDVDAGPVLAGFSPAANAYGVAAARAQGRFDHAYDAIRVLAELVLHANGYAVSKGTHQHQRVIDSLEFSLGGDFAAEVAFFDQARRLRHQSMYERTGVVQQKDADDLLDAAKRLYTRIQQWLPEKLPKQ